MAFERRQLAGVWDLLSFETFPEPGQGVEVSGSATMEIDEFGNFDAEGQLENLAADGAGISLELINVTGQVVIDVARQRLMITDEESDVSFDEGELASLTPDNFRYYEIVDDELTMTVQDASGETTARLVWQRR